MTLAELEKKVTALPAPPPFDYHAAETRRKLEARIVTARAARDTLTEVGPRLAEYEKWHAHLIDWREKLCNQLLEHAGPRDTQRNLFTLSIRRIDRGLDLMNECYPVRLPLDDLMKESGYAPTDLIDRANGGAWLGSLPYVEQRLRDLQKQRDQEQARLNDALRDD
jgi:hypothetical protein